MARGRRVNSNGEKSKQLLLEKAIELFSTHGYHQTKISDIVKAADLTQPTFYLYFQSKESLFNDLNEQFQNDLRGIFIGGKEPFTLESDLGIGVSLTKIFDYFVENPNLAKIGFYESEQAVEVKEILINNFMKTIEHECQDTDTLQNVNVRTVADSLLGSIERLVLTTLLTKEKTSNELSADLVNIYFSSARKLVR